jgi:sigma-B regulation protein RsbU (phosphoserine phosphatase)
VRQFSFSSLRTKLILAFLGVALIPLLLLSWLNKHSAQVTLTNNANQALYAAASQTALTLDAFIEIAVKPTCCLRWDIRR